MSDEQESSPEISPKSSAEAAPRARKVATPRPKKAAKSAAPAKEEIVPLVADPAPSAPAEPSAPSAGEWPEPEAASNGGASPQSESGKRKRRRRKGKGQASAPNAGGSQNEDFQPGGMVEPKPADAPREQGPRPNPQPQQPRPKIDPEHLAKMAWKIYLAEVSEEGVALIGDNDAKDLSRRCFRLAEIFIEEQARRR
ncbi:MAG: hypothetical protein ABIS50_16850 [Luteolibacter sp.]|uniref:hypothetical protein n=1 Tax=Luteolibacter sp. TaxID=1962973 RepID=UPI003264BFCF